MIAAVADIAGKDNAPLRFAVGGYGLTMAREKIKQQLNDYATWENVTLATD